MLTKRRTLKCCLLVILLSAVLLLVLAAGSGEAEGRTITVDDDGGADYEKIQWAIDNATEGDTILVYEGTYYENVVVNKTLTLIGNGSEKTTIDGGGSGDVVKITADWCNMSGFTVTGGSTGMVVESDSNLITGSTIRDNPRGGIYLHESNSSTIQDNTIMNNSGDGGVHVHDSNANTILNNAILNNSGDGSVWFHSSNSNILTNNTIRNNSNGILIYEWSISNIIANNTIRNNTEYGIWIYGSGSNTVANNFIHNNTNYGIYLNLGAASNTITNNTCQYNKGGILLISSSNSKISNNTILNNTDCGIHLDLSPSNTITNNTISGNYVGINVTYDSKNNTAHYNRIFNNTRRGARTYYYTYEFDARFNYWGSNSGPHHPWANPKGKGDYITDGVNFRPWLNADGTVSQSSFPSEDKNDNNHYFVFLGTSIFILFFLIGFILVISEPFRFSIFRFLSVFFPKSQEQKIKNDTEQQGVRKDIVQLIEDNPGIRLSQIEQKTSTGYITRVHHLAILQKEGHIKSTEEGRTKRFWKRKSEENSE